MPSLAKFSLAKQASAYGALKNEVVCLVRKCRQTIRKHPWTKVIPSRLFGMCKATLQKCCTMAVHSTTYESAFMRLSYRLFDAMVKNQSTGFAMFAEATVAGFFEDACDAYVRMRGNELFPTEESRVVFYSQVNVLFPTV